MTDVGDSMPTSARPAPQSQPMSLEHVAVVAGTLAVSGGVLALCLTQESILFLNLSFLVWGCVVMLAAVMTVPNRTMPKLVAIGFVPLAVGALAVLVASITVGVDVPGGHRNFTCNGTSLAAALYNDTAPIEAVERPFTSSCGAGWSELLNYKGMRVGRKCCVHVDIRNMNCLDTGLRLVADATSNPQVLTNAHEREAAVNCCPSIGAEVTPAGYATMITTALSSTILAVIVNAFRRSWLFKFFVTSPLQKILACFSGLSNGCGTCLIAMFGLCFSRRNLLGARGRAVRSRAKLTVSTEIVSTLSTALSATYHAPTSQLLMIEDDGGAEAGLKNGAACLTTEFSVDGSHVLALNSCASVTSCGRYSFVCGSDEQGNVLELLYDMRYQDGVHRPVRMMNSSKDKPLAQTNGGDSRYASVIPSLYRIDTSPCSRFTSFINNESGALTLRPNVPISTLVSADAEGPNGAAEHAAQISDGLVDVELPYFSCDRNYIEYNGKDVAIDQFCARAGKSTAFVGVVPELKCVVVVDVVGLLCAADVSSDRVIQFPSTSLMHNDGHDDDNGDDTPLRVALTSTGYLVAFHAGRNVVEVLDVLSDDCALVQTISVPTDFERDDILKFYVDEHQDRVLLRGVRRDGVHQWITVAVQLAAAAADTTNAEPLSADVVTVLDTESALAGLEPQDRTEGVFASTDLVRNDGGVAAIAGAEESSATRFVYFKPESASPSYSWEFPKPIVSFDACRREDGTLMVFAVDDKDRFYIRNGSDGADIVPPVALTDAKQVSLSMNGALLLVRTGDKTMIYSTNVEKGGTLEDKCVSSIVGDFYRASISPDGRMAAFERRTDWLLTVVAGSSACSVATPSADVAVTVTVSTPITLKVSVLKLQDDDHSRPAGQCGLSRRRRIGRAASCVASYDVLLPNATRSVYLSDDAALLVVHCVDGRLALYDTSVVRSAPQRKEVNGGDVDDDEELQRSIACVRRIPADGVEFSEFTHVRCAVSAEGICGIVCLLRSAAPGLVEGAASDVSRTQSSTDMTMEARVLYARRGTLLGAERLVLRIPPPPAPNAAAKDEDTLEVNIGSGDDVKILMPRVEDVALNCDGTLLALWLANHEEVLVFPVTRGATDVIGFSTPQNAPLPLDALVLEPSPLLAEHYTADPWWNVGCLQEDVTNVWRASCMGRLQFLSGSSTALVRYSRPANHWTYHVEEWDLAPKPRDETLAKTLDVRSEQVDVGVATNGVDEAQSPATGVPYANYNRLAAEDPGEYVIAEPVRTDRVGYMTGEPTSCALQMSASGNHLVYLSTNGVSLYRRPPTGDDSDADANAFFWWSGFVADLYAPSEYLLIPALCLAFGFISSIVTAAMNGEGYTGFVIRTVNGSALQNWIDIMSVFACRSVIVRSRFLPVCGDAEMVVVSTNEPVSIRATNLQRLNTFMLSQLSVVIVYPMLLTSFTVALGYVLVPLMPLMCIVGFVGAIAAAVILVPRSFDRTRWIGPRASLATEGVNDIHPATQEAITSEEDSRSGSFDTLRTKFHFYSVMVRFFITAFVMMIGCNFTLQIGLRMGTNAGLLMTGSGDYAKYYDPCLQFSGSPCGVCVANQCSFCPTTKLCVSSGRTDSPCGDESSTSVACHAYHNATCAKYQDDGPSCVGWEDCAYCSSTGSCTITSNASSCPVAVVTSSNSTFAQNSTAAVAWWEKLPYLSRTTAAYAQLLFYELQISSGTCSAARVAETAWAQANYIAALP